MIRRIVQGSVRPGRRGERCLTVGGESHGEPRAGDAQSRYMNAPVWGLSAGGGEEVGLGRGRRVVKKKRRQGAGQQQQSPRCPGQNGGRQGRGAEEGKRRGLRVANVCSLQENQLPTTSASVQDGESQGFARRASAFDSRKIERRLLQREVVRY